MMKQTIIVLMFVLAFSPTVLAQQPPMIEIDDAGIVGKTAPTVALARLGGGTVSLDALRGKVVLVSFWASWCGPCKREMPELDKLYKELEGKGLEVVGINVDRDEADAKRWLARYPVSFPIGLDPDSKMLGLYGVESMPTSFVIDRQGVVRKKTIGFKPEYLEEIKKLIATL